MQTLISAALQFPTIVFTFLLALIALYWLLVLIRLAPLELFERDSLRDDHMASTLVSLGFAGVPATLALSFLMLIAGALSLAVELLALREQKQRVGRGLIGRSRAKSRLAAVRKIQALVRRRAK